MSDIRKAEAGSTPKASVSLKPRLFFLPHLRRPQLTRGDIVSAPQMIDLIVTKSKTRWAQPTSPKPRPRLFGDGCGPCPARLHQASILTESSEDEGGVGAGVWEEGAV